MYLIVYFILGNEEMCRIYAESEDKYGCADQLQYISEISDRPSLWHLSGMPGLARSAKPC
jgi:hypothetical protein